MVGSCGYAHGNASLLNQLSLRYKFNLGRLNRINQRGPGPLPGRPPRGLWRRVTMPPFGLMVGRRRRMGCVSGSFGYFHGQKLSQSFQRDFSTPAPPEFFALPALPSFSRRASSMSCRHFRGVVPIAPVASARSPFASSQPITGGGDGEASFDRPCPLRFIRAVWAMFAGCRLILQWPTL